MAVYHGVLGRVALCSDRRRDPCTIPKIKALWDAVLALLHDRIYTECYRFMELGYITRDGLRNLNYLYKTYHVMGGNGTGTELYKRACALPIHD